MPTLPQPTTRDELRAAQLAAVRRLIAVVLPRNEFYVRKLGSLHPRDVDSLEVFAKLPFTTKAELTADQAQHPPYGTNLTVPLTHYTRFHQTSGTSTGHPL